MPEHPKADTTVLTRQKHLKLAIVNKEHLNQTRTREENRQVGPESTSTVWNMPESLNTVEYHQNHIAPTTTIN